MKKIIIILLVSINVFAIHTFALEKTLFSLKEEKNILLLYRIESLYKSFKTAAEFAKQVGLNSIPQNELYLKKALGTKKLPKMEIKKSELVLMEGKVIYRFNIIDPDKNLFKINNTVLTINPSRSLEVNVDLIQKSIMEAPV